MCKYMCMRDCVCKQQFTFSNKSPTKVPPPVADCVPGACRNKKWGACWTNLECLPGFVTETVSVQEVATRVTAEPCSVEHFCMPATRLSLSTCCYNSLAVLGCRLCSCIRSPVITSPDRFVASDGLQLCSSWLQGAGEESEEDVVNVVTSTLELLDRLSLTPQLIIRSGVGKTVMKLKKSGKTTSLATLQN